MTDTLFERWEVIPGFPMYEASTEGRIRNRESGYILQPWEDLNNRGVPYLRVTLCSAGGTRSHAYVHRVVLLTFEPKDEAELYDAHHINGDTMDPRYVNLRWERKEEHGLLTRIENGYEPEEPPF